MRTSRSANATCCGGCRWSSATAIALIEEALGQKVAECLASFEAEQIAAASVAQVHAATIRDGASVAVKVLRNGICKRINADIGVLRALVRWPTLVLATSIGLMAGIVMLFVNHNNGVEFFVDEEPQQATVMVSARGNLSAQSMRDSAVLQGRYVMGIEHFRAVVARALAERAGRDTPNDADRLAATLGQSTLDHAYKQWLARDGRGDLRAIVHQAFATLETLADRERSHLAT